MVMTFPRPMKDKQQVGLETDLRTNFPDADRMSAGVLPENWVHSRPHHSSPSQPSGLWPNTHSGLGV